MSVAIAVLSILGASAAAVSGNWDRLAEISPTGDQAGLLLDALTTADGSGVVFHGYYSHIPLGHPGPVLAWVLALGMLVARPLGLDVLQAAFASYVLVCTTLLALGGWFTAKALRNAWAGTAAVVAVLFIGWMQWRSGEINGVFTLAPIYGPNFARYLSFASSAALLALAGRWSKASGWCIILGGLTLQASLETAPLGIICVLCGIGGFSVPALRFGVTAVVRRSMWALGMFAAVFWPFVWRMRLEGWDLPFRYATSILEHSGSATPEMGGTSNYTDLVLPNVGLSTLSASAIVLAAGVVACAVGVLYRPTRRQALAGLGLYLVALSLASQVQTPHQILLISVLVPLTVFPAGAIVVSALCAALVRRIKVPSIPATVVVLLSACVGIAANASTYGRADLAEKATRSLPVGAELAEAIESRVDSSGQVAAVFAWDIDGTSDPSPTTIAEILLATKRAGVSLCLQPGIPERGRYGRPMYPVCRYALPTTWVVFSPAGTLPDAAIGPFVLDHTNSDPPPISVEVHFSDAPEKLGFAVCNNPPSRMRYSWLGGKHCDL